MKIIIKATNISLSPNIKARVEEKMAGLDRFLRQIDPQTIEMRVEVGRTTRGQRRGDVFRAEANLRIGGKIIRVEHTTGDLYAAIDLVKDELARRITREQEKKATIFTRGARSWKKFWQLNPLARMRKSKLEK